MVITAKGVHCTDMPLVLLNKPCGVLSQFRDDTGRSTLADFVTSKNVYPAGRLDRDSEGLLLLTDDGRLQARISQPKSKTTKTYWAQVEGDAQDSQLGAQARCDAQGRTGSSTRPSTAESYRTTRTNCGRATRLSVTA